MAGSVFNFINSIIGAGIIGMPYALADAGFCTGLVLIVVVGIITDYSIRLLIRDGLLTHKMSYQDMVLFCLGRRGFQVLSFAQFTFPFFGMAAYSIIVGQTLPKIFDRMLGESILSNPRMVIFVATLCIMLPLSLNKELEKLSKWSALALLGVAIITLTVIVRGALVEPPADRGELFTVINPRVVQAIGVLSFAYVCHHNSFLIYGSLVRASEQRFAQVTHISVGSAAVVSVALAVGGYLAFGRDAKADILDNFAQDDDAINVARFFFALAVMLTYPIECFVAREVINTYFFDSEITERRHNLITIGLSATVLGIALATDNLGVVLEADGVLSATLLAFILPAVSYLAIKRAQPWDREKAKALLLAIFGFLVLVIGTVLIIIELAS
eukprot:m.83514 g.83514  ORF g.83514 m.83514 type:complete len:386 (+) comp17724_c0_seq2:179-1336(+)